MLRRVHRVFSRTRWTARLLNRPRADAGDAPGLIVLQIDGLSRRQFEHATAAGRLPFLHRMIRRGHYDLVSFYSGCPSTTPAVQGEVMFGVRCAVPAFQYLDRARGRVVRMFDADAAHAVAERLAKLGDPLLRGGASFSNIYVGGADDARFCAETLEQDKQRLVARPWRPAMAGLLYAPTALRIAALTLLELVIAIGDLLRGLGKGEDWRAEGKFIASRIAVSIVLREYLRVMVKLAVEEGRPVIYANFLGYDEHAHRRGPGSWFAHWVLKGVDRIIRDISRTARRSTARDYEVVVFSDHGQESTTFYDHVEGRSIQDAIRDAFSVGSMAGRGVRWPAHVRNGAQDLNDRARRLLRGRRQDEESVSVALEEIANDVVVTALGPLGHVYLPGEVDDQAKDEYARRLVEVVRAPLALYRDRAGVVIAHNRFGRWPMPDSAARVLGVDHPYLQEAAADLVELCRHPDAGDLVISGWEPGRQPMTFVLENGSHGSVGGEEVRGFALLPDGMPTPRRTTAAGEDYVRGEDLHEAGRRFLGAGEPSTVRPKNRRVSTPVSQASAALRVMTYNVHSCIGIDGQVRPQRVLQVIRSAGADIVALQEVDVNRVRSRRDNQAKFLAERLEMSHHYFAVLEDQGEQYGLAIISRWPLRHVQSSHLTPADPRRRREARGALWVEIDAPGGPVQLINTHFGLTRHERQRQAAQLAGTDWLGSAGADQAIVLCGDLNATPRSPEFHTLTKSLRDVQAYAPSHRPQATFPSLAPMRRLDHILVSRNVTVLRVMQPRTPTAVLASDHLPLCADLVIAEAASMRSLETCPAAAAVSPIRT